MMKSYSHYDRLALLFTYPGRDYPVDVRKVQAELDTAYPTAGVELQGFTNFVCSATEIGLQELYTRSFDVQAITTLDLGYVLFGDDYKRGALLVNLNREHRQAGVDCRNELADHLPNVLRLLSSMRQRDLREEMVAKIVAPALRKIIGEFDPQKVEAKNEIYRKHHRTLIERPAEYGAIYRKPLRALHMVLADDFAIREKTLSRGGTDFLRSIGTEIEVEA